MDIAFRCWNFVDLVCLCEQYGFKCGAEIGVYNGVKSKAFLEHMELNKLYLVDPYIEYEDKGINDSQLIHDARYNLICAIFKNTNAEIVRKTSREAINDISDNSLDFVYIDADHNYEEVKWDIENWARKVKVGGIVSGHDFHYTFAGVQKAVLKYCDKHNVSELDILEQENIWMFKKEAENE